MAWLRTWSLLAVVLLTGTCLRGGRPDPMAPPPLPRSSAPISLVTTDGVELQLLSVKAEALLAEPMAFTELHLRFRNPEARVLEGRFRIVLPPSATVARFAMKVQGVLEEAELVELSQAHEAYEMFLHARQDPALLEQGAGNEFSARIFPIAPKEEKEIVIGYSEELVDPDKPYRIALAGLSVAGEIAVTVREAGSKGVEQRTLKLTAAQDFVSPLAGGERLVRTGPWIVGRVKLPGTTTPAPMRSLAVLFDTSASRALGLRQQIQVLRQLLAEARAQNPKLDLRVLAFDQETVEIFHGPAADFGEAQERALLDRDALGASNLDQALRALASRLKQGPADRVWLIGDGVTTAGALDGASLTEDVASLAAGGAQRFDAIVVGGLRDEARLASLVAGLAEGGVVLDGGRSAAWLWSRLGQRADKSFAVPAIAGAEWQLPKHPKGVLPGDYVMTVARLESPKAAAGAGAIEIDSSTAPLFERAVARAQIVDIEEQLDQASTDNIGALVSRLVELSLTERVLCRLTGFVVLENNGAWQRTRAVVKPSKILSLDASGLHVSPHSRETGSLAPSWQRERPEPAPPPEFDEEPLSHVVVDRVEESLVKSSRSEGASSGSVAPSRPAEKPKAPPPASQPAVVGSGTQTSGLPQLGPEPDDALANTDPHLRIAGTPAQVRAASLPPPPTYRPGDFDKLPKPYSGDFAEVMRLLDKGAAARALAQAQAWHAADPGLALALVALGESYRTAGDARRAARAFGSLIDLFPARPDVRRFAAGRLASLHDTAALDLAIDSAWRAVVERPDHPSGHHLLATFLMEAGRFEQAFAVLSEALQERFDPRFLAADRILREDAALAAQAWMKRDPARAPELHRRLNRLHAQVEERPSLRFVLTWESDESDVDFHVRDGHGYHAYYRKPTLPTGGELYADVRQGYGPECFTLRQPPASRAYPYRLAIRYARRGPMGYGMGTLQIIEHDGSGGLRFEHRPYIIMNDGGYLELPEIQGSR